MNCTHCSRPCKSIVGLRSHERTCKCNPNRIKGKNGNGWSKVDKDAFSAKVRLSNSKRSPEVNARISETCRRKAASGNWHHGAGTSKKSVYRGVKMDSSWERKLAEHWDRVGVVWERCDETFPYEWSGLLRSYNPDFYLPELDTYVEVKGFKTDRDLAKWTAFPHMLEIYDQERFNVENIEV